MIDRIRWLGHGGFLIQGPPFIFINPWRVVRTAFHADVILIGHEHYDHCSVADVSKLRGPDTIIIGNEQVADQIDNVTILRPWQSITVDRASIKAIPAYSPRGVQHARHQNGLGFVISLDYFDIYYAGDTEIIPEMDRIQPDIAILPIDDDHTLGVREAVEVVEQMRPRWVFPANWGTPGEGVTRFEAQTFKRQIGGRARVILPDDDTVND